MTFPRSLSSALWVLVRKRCLYSFVSVFAFDACSGLVGYVYARAGMRVCGVCVVCCVGLSLCVCVWCAVLVSLSVCVCVWCAVLVSLSLSVCVCVVCCV